MKYELNEEQKVAMLATEGAVLVTAGAGSGKTRLLTQRIAYLIQEKGINGYNILAITFTNKAAREMKERIEGIIGGMTNVWISTIHSMCAQILRRDIDKLNPKYTSNFTIYTPDDCAKVVKRVVLGEDREEGSDAHDKLIKQVEFHLSNMKNTNASYEEYFKDNIHLPNIEDIMKAIKKYQEMLENSNALDFDDLLTFTENLLKNVESVREYYANRFQYILVDEFQDTNIVQYNIVKLLASKHKNIFVVGDEDQCIYGWRGANIKNIQNFMKDYDEHQLFKLEHNYRSTKNILDIANKLISKNTDRIPKVLITDKEQGNSVIYRTFDSDRNEAEFVAQKIATLHSQGIDYKDMAVLMRLNSLSRLFEEKMLAYNIPHAVFGGFKFFDRLEVKNVIAYLRLLVNPNDISSFVRIINYPKRKIGEMTVDKVISASNSFGVSVMETCGRIDEVSTINSGTRKKIKEFYEIIADVQNYLNEHLVSESIDYLIKRAGIKEMYSDRSEDSRNRLGNLNSLIQSAQEFEESVDSPNLINYLENVTLVNDAEMESDLDKVAIASVHAVKGLEFKIVFIIGAEQKVFPIERVDKTDEEEERRLMYVAVTRAKEQLYITNSSKRFLYGRQESMMPSKFLKEMGFVSSNTYDALSSGVQVKTYGVSRSYDDYNDNYEDSKPIYSRPMKSQTLTELNKTCTYQPEKKVIINADKYAVGKKISHSHYGEGVITKIDGQGESTSLTIQFDVVGQKVLMLKFASLTLLD